MAIRAAYGNLELDILDWLTGWVGGTHVDECVDGVDEGHDVRVIRGVIAEFMNNSKPRIDYHD